MNEIVRSRNAMMLAAFGAAVGVLAEITGVLAFASLNANNVGTASDFGHAHDWLFFGGWLVILGAVGLVAWDRVGHGQRALGPFGPEALELGGATLATLFIAIGTLVSAASTDSTTGATLAAVGIGLWGLLALTRAARQNLSDHQTTSSDRIGRLTVIWLGVAVGLILLAVGIGIGFNASSQGSSIASGAIAAVGIAIWAGAMAVARNHQLLTSPLVRWVLVALGLAAASYVAEAVVAGIVFGTSGTLTELRIGGAIIEALLGLAIAVFGYAAWLRAGELPVLDRTAGPVAPSATPPQFSSQMTSSAASSMAPRPGGRFCTSCGAALPEGATFCSSCGTQVQSAP